MKQRGHLTLQHITTSQTSEFNIEAFKQVVLRCFKQYWTKVSKFSKTCIKSTTKWQRGILAKKFIRLDQHWPRSGYGSTMIYHIQALPVVRSWKWVHPPVNSVLYGCQSFSIYVFHCVFLYWRVSIPIWLTNLLREGNIDQSLPLRASKLEAICGSSGL